jgi:hypothetical protein
MRVGVQCEADLRMRQRFHDGARVHPLREQEGRRGVPKVMEANRLESQHVVEIP